MLFEQSGWSAERLLLVAVQRVNDVFNAPARSRNAPGLRSPRGPGRTSATAAARRRRRPQLGAALRREAAPGRNPRFWLRPPDDSRSPLTGDVAAVRWLLGLQPGKDELTLTAFSVQARAHRG